MMLNWVILSKLFIIKSTMPDVKEVLLVFNSLKKWRKDHERYKKEVTIE